jgi:hypothetical protein
MTTDIGTAWIPGFDTLDLDVDTLDPQKHQYIDDPSGWIHDVLGEETWSKQREILESVRDNRHTAVQSCHSTGKSYTSSRAACWWLDVHKPGEAFVVTTAPTQPQVNAILWREIRNAHHRGGLKGRITLDSHWYMGDNELVAYGRKPQDYVDPELAMQAFQGIHARYILIILDEACGIPEWLWDAVETLASNVRARVLAIGNPDDPATTFETNCRPGSGWHNITISAFDTPAYTDEKVSESLLEMLISPVWVEERKQRWGEKSPRYVSKVLGLFPDVSEDSLISPKMIREAQERELAGIAKGRYGVDVARFGSSDTVVYRNRGGRIRLKHKASKQDTMVTADEVFPLLQNGVEGVIDADGVGGGVFDRLNQLEAPVIPFHGGQTAFEPTKYKNRRSEQYWMLRTLMEDGIIDIDDENDDLAAQLGNIKWKQDASGRIHVETKDEMKKRGVPSPDHADSVMMSTVVDAWSPPDPGEESVSSITGDLLNKET